MQEDTEDTNQALYKPSNKNSSNGKITTKIRNLSGSKKLLIFGGGGLGLGFIFFLIFIFFLANFELPNLMQTIQDYAFASVTDYANDAANNIYSQALALEAAPKETSPSETPPSSNETSPSETPPSSNETPSAEPTSDYADIEQEFESASPSLWQTINNIRPSNIIKNFNESNDIGFGYQQSFTGGLTLKSITFGGEEFTLNNTTGILTHVPIISDFIKANDFANNWAEIFPKLQAAADEANLGLLSRAIIYKDYFLKMGGNLDGFSLYLFKKIKSDKEADAVAADGLAKDVEDGDNNALPPTIVSGENQDTQKIETDIENETNSIPETEQALNSPASVLKPGGAQDLLNQVGTNGLLGEITQALNPIYAYGLPICIIYQGSMVNSGPTINNTLNEQSDAYNGLLSEANQEVAGSSSQSKIYPGALAYAKQGANNNLGDFSNSDIERLASGGKINTLDSIQPEAAIDGTYKPNIITALLHNSILSQFLQKAFSLCPYITNIKISFAVAVASIIASSISGIQAFNALLNASSAADAAGAADAADSAGSLSGAVDTEVDDVAEDGIIQKLQNFYKTVFEKQTVKTGVNSTVTTSRFKIVGASILGPIKNIISRETIAKIGISIILGILLKKYIVSNSIAADSGVVTGPALANEALSGALVQASEINRSNDFGRPLSESEMTQQDIQSSQALGNNPNQQSLYKKYASLSNPFSLVSRIAVSIDSLKNTITINNFLSYIGQIFNPMKLVNNVFNIFNNQPALAAAYANPISTNFGIIQFGWSNQEIARIKSNISFYPLENQKILTDSGQEGNIAKTYASCFGYSYNSSGNTFNPTSPNSKLLLSKSDQIGNLLASGSIVRNSEGYVMNSGFLCSQQNLGYNNPTFGHNVFRFRLAMLYDAIANSLCNASYISDNNNLRGCY